jgi:hypothetical protein
VFALAGVVMLAVQFTVDRAWEGAEARIERVGVVCDLSWVEWHLSRRARRPQYKTLPCAQVAQFRAANPDIDTAVSSFKVKEVIAVDVQFTTARGRVVTATGRHGPYLWKAPGIGETAAITYNPSDPIEIAFSGKAKAMYLAAGVFILLGAVLCWTGWPWSGLPSGARPAIDIAARLPRAAPTGEFGQRRRTF